jgi:hypothetical protein
MCLYLDIEGTRYYHCLRPSSEAMTLSEMDTSEGTLAGESLFGTPALVIASVVTCTPQRSMAPVPALSWESVIATPPCPSSVSRRLSREFRLEWNVRYQDVRGGVTNKEDTHGHERAEIESNDDEGGWGVYERISILGELRSRIGCQYLIRKLENRK